MDRHEAADYLRKMALAVELLGEGGFRRAAFLRAAQTLRAIDDQTWQRWLGSGQVTLSGIGKGIGRRLREFAHTGSASDLEELLLRIPPGVMDLLRIRGLGPARARTLWQEANIVTLSQLRRACQRGRLSALPGFGKGLEVQILHEIRLLRRSQGRWLRLGALRLAEEKGTRLREIADLRQLTLAGEIRRGRETVTEIVWVAAANDPALLLGRLATLKGTAISENQPDTVLLNGEDEPPQRILVTDPAHYAARLFLETGSTTHTRALLRSLGQSEEVEADAAPLGGWLPASEEEIYARAGLPWIPPELREGRGEITAARQKQLPDLVRADDLRGVFHVHTDWSDGRIGIEHVAREARRLGWEYVGIADHSQAAFYAHGLSPERLIEQGRELRAQQREFPELRLFHGVECDIHPDGSLDYEDAVLAQLDYVIVSVHSVMQMDRDTMTRRIVRALQHPQTTMLGHPSGRLLLEREPYAVEWDAIFAAAAEAGVALEFSTAPERLDLDWRLIRNATGRGVRLCINPDAHRLEALRHLASGVTTARKGWLTAAQVLNTRSAEELMEEFDVT